MATNSIWKKVWRMAAKERVRQFVWLLCHDRLLTNVRKAKMNFGTAHCHHCRYTEETTLHVMRDCPFALTVWMHLVNHTKRAQFFEYDLQEWISVNMMSNMGNDSDWDWQAVWANACHQLWMWRNKFIHDKDFVSPWKPWTFAIKEATDYQAIDRVQINKNHRTRVTKMVGWVPPRAGWVKVNTNGASNTDCGGLARDQNGLCLGGFSKSLGMCNAYVAELWGVYNGVLFAKTKGYQHFILETDSATIVKLLQGTEKIT